VDGFLSNEKYHKLDLSDSIYLKRDTPLFGIYGDEEGMFNATERNYIKFLLNDFN